MIRVQTEDVDIGALITAAKKPGTGAVVVFDGIVRDDGITEMELEAYGDVAVAEMEKIAKEATAQFRLLHVDIIHRIGRLCDWREHPHHCRERRPPPGGLCRFALHHRGDQKERPRLEEGAHQRRRALGVRRTRAWDGAPLNSSPV